MLIKLKIGNYLMLLLALFLILQFIPGTFDNIECIDSHTQNATIIFSNHAVNTDIVLLTFDGRKTSFHSISVEVYDYLIEHVSVAYVSEDQPVYYVTPSDYRKEIKQKILNYFHGSKYKESNLII